MIESSRKHGPFDARWAGRPGGARRAGVLETQPAAEGTAAAVRIWEGEGGSTRSLRALLGAKP